jgi:hypothetical protein
MDVQPQQPTRRPIPPPIQYVYPASIEPETTFGETAADDYDWHSGLDDYLADQDDAWLRVPPLPDGFEELILAAGEPDPLHPPSSDDQLWTRAPWFQALRRRLIARGVPEAWLKRLPDDLYEWVRAHVVSAGHSGDMVDEYLPCPLPLPGPACALLELALPPDDSSDDEPDPTPEEFRAHCREMGLPEPADVEAWLHRPDEEELRERRKGMELCALCHTWHRPDDCLLNPRRDWVLRGPSVLPHKPNGKTTWDHSQPEPEAEPKHISSKPPELTAYMLPDGIYAVVWCAHCRLWHRHGEAIGDYRQAHCRTTASPYVGHGPGSGYKLIGGEPAPAWVLEDLRRERPNPRMLPLIPSYRRQPRTTVGKAAPRPTRTAPSGAT